MEWIWKKALQSSAKRAIQAVIAILGQAKIQSFLNANGVSITIDPTLASAGLYALLEFGRSWLKVGGKVKFL